jgi:hypothetical protein
MSDQKTPMALADLSNTYPVKSKDVTWKVLDGETVLLNLDTGIYFTLNATGTGVWELFDGQTSLAETARALCEQFDVTLEQAERDCMELAKALMDEGLVRITDDTSTTQGTHRA